MNAGLDKETLDMIIDSIKEFTSSELTDKKLIELDEKDEFQRILFIKCVVMAWVFIFFLYLKSLVVQEWTTRVIQLLLKKFLAVAPQPEF